MSSKIKTSPIKYRFSPSPPLTQHSQDQWRDTIKQVAPAVLAMEMTYARPFENDHANKGSGTAFIVDKDRGIALTNQHCATDAPATFTLRFLNGEEVPAHRIYTDPIYDFAFVKFDTTLIEYMKVVEIVLYPEGARPGLEIQVIGNDSDEKLLICRGTIMDLEFYDEDNKGIDAFHNTATVVIESGSSGSPAVDISGRAVGLNSNGNEGQAGLLPLNKIVDALATLQKGFDSYGNWSCVKVPRKTLGALFCLKSLEELLDDGDIAEEDSSSLGEEYGNLLFKVEHVRMDCGLQENDLLLELNYEKVGVFEEVESILDAMDVAEVTIKVARENPNTGCLEKVILHVEVFDAEDAKADCILEIAGSSIYTSSHRMALFNEIDVGCLVVQEPGASMENYIHKKTIVKCINGKYVTCLSDFLEVLKRTTEKAGDIKVDLQRFDGEDEFTTSTGSIFYQWLSIAFLWQFSQETNAWTRKAMELQIPNVTIGITSIFNRSNLFLKDESKCFSDYPDPVDTMKRSFVGVGFKLPSYISNINNLRLAIWVWGTGVVIHHTSKFGVVLATKSNVPHMLGSIILRFKADLNVHGTVFFVDDYRGFSLIFYDSELLGSNLENIKPAKLSREHFRMSDKINLLCHDQTQKHFVTTENYLKYVIKEFSHDRVDANIHCDINNMSGLIADKSFKINALVGNVKDSFQDLKIYPVSSILKPLELLMESMLTDPLGLCHKVKLPVFHANLISIPSYTAIKMGLHRRLLNMNFKRSQFLMVKSCLPGSNAAKILKPEDVILSVNGQYVCCIQDLDMHLFSEKDLNIRILRHGFEQDVCVEREFFSKPKKTKILSWCGLLVQDSPRDEQFNEGFMVKTGVLVNGSYYFFGNNPDELSKDCCWINKVNGMEVNNLDEFVKAISKFKDGDDVLCQLITWNGVAIAYNYHLDFLHFPTMGLKFDEVRQIWNHKEISSPRNSSQRSIKLNENIMFVSMKSHTIRETK